MLVTRPEPGASKTAERLRGLDYEAIVLPLSAIVPLMPETSLESVAFDAIAVTSANAVRHTPGYFWHMVGDRPVFAVGNETANALRRAGCYNVHAGTGNADGLASLITGRVVRGTRVLYPCSEVRRLALENLLEQVGIEVIPVEVYGAEPILYERDTFLAGLGTEPVFGALLYSPEGAQALLPWMRDPVVAPLLAGTRLICMSAQIAKVVEKLGNDVILAHESTENALFARLRDLSAQRP